MPPLDTSASDDADASEAGATTSATIEIDFEYVNPANVDQATLEQALAPLASIPLTGNVRVVVTSDMAESLASRVQSSYSDPFRVDRVGAGRVTAKTVTDLAASTEILIDAVALLPDLRGHTEISLRRLMRHEGLHLLLRLHSEDAHSVVRALEPCNEADKSYYWMAALALEEFRIERHLCSRGSFVSESYDDEMPRVLHDYYSEFETVARSWGSDSDAPVRILSMTNDLVSKVAFVVGQHDVRPAVSDAVIGSLHWRAMIGPAWNAFRASVTSVPDAGERLTAEQLKPIVVEFAAVVASWCEHIGFRLLDDGELCVETLFEVDADGSTPTALAAVSA
jgi:hypothetical protein